MKNHHLAGANIDQLLRLYADAATRHAVATENGDYRSANREHDTIAAVYRELRKRGSEAQMELIPLLDHPDLGVKAWVASHALEFAPERGKQALEELANQPGLLGHTARTTLLEWFKGRLRFP